MSLRISKVVLLLSVFCCLPLGVSAHTTGASWNAPSGVYTVDVGYDATVFSTVSPVRFDFLLWKGALNTTPANFDQVWVRLYSADATVLATGLFHQPLGPTTLLYQFGSGGSYTISASFRDADGNEIASGNFPILVSSAQTQQLWWVWFLAGLVIGAVCLWVLRRIK